MARIGNDAQLPYPLERDRGKEDVVERGAIAALRDLLQALASNRRPRTGDAILGHKERRDRGREDDEFQHARARAGQPPRQWLRARRRVRAKLRARSLGVCERRRRIAAVELKSDGLLEERGPGVEDA